MHLASFKALRRAPLARARTPVDAPAADPKRLERSSHDDLKPAGRVAGRYRKPAAAPSARDECLWKMQDVLELP